MIKKIVILLLMASLLLSLTACGSAYGVSALETLVEQSYSLAFRNGDDTTYYVVAALEQLNAEGTVEELSRKWFGRNIISFGKRAGAVDKLGDIPPQTFIIGIDTDSFPMAYKDSNGQYFGFDVELAGAVAEKLGWTLQIQPILKEDVYIELYSGNIDCAWGGIVLDEKELAKEKYTQYGPYVKNDIVVAVRENSGIFNQLQLHGKHMAMCATDEAMAALETDEKLVKRLGQITRLPGGTTECFEFLYYGNCDAVLTDSTALDYFNCH